MSPLLTLFTISFALLAGAKGYSVLTYECPQEDLGACTCLDPYGKVFVQCTGLSNRQQLVDAFRKMAGRGITELQIRNSNVSHIPRDLFRDSPVSRIVIKNSMMIYLFDRQLEKGEEQLSDIVLERVDFGGGLDWSVLDNLVSLKTLSVSGSNMKNVPYCASELELQLETLLLEDNYIDYVHELAFHKLKGLKNLKLSKNYLEQYTRSILPLPESGLQFLDLSFNKLKSLPSDAFDGMTELHSLLLRGNHFSVLERSYMSNVFSSLFYLDVASNPLLCSCDLTWILSSNKPFHLFGECKTSRGARSSRNLKDLTSDDFVLCPGNDVAEDIRTRST